MAAGAPMAEAGQGHSLGVPPAGDQSPHAVPPDPVQPHLRGPLRLGHLLSPKALLRALQPGHCPVRALRHRVAVAPGGKTLVLILCPLVLGTGLDSYQASARAGRSSARHPENMPLDSHIYITHLL